ncbi:SDR family oxidoreductase [Rheinheimera tangshanensis]|nr:3-oxoacyl-ACP reductase [Rheinheimera sp. KL1]GGM59582.1 3-oxoacyl-ACP reductase [Rheinheimera tangshanensis]
MQEATVYPSLSQKVVFITGGASGIGAAMVRAFAAQQAQVAFIDVDLDAAETLQQELSSSQLWFRQVDVRQPSLLQKAIQDAAKDLGAFDVLVNNVANDKRQPTAEVTSMDWQQCMQVNLDPAFFASQSAFELMKVQQHGCIINFSSINALVGQQQMAGYVTAKAGIIGMTKALAKDYGNAGIRVNAILPGWVATERQLATWFTSEEQQKWLESSAIKRLITPRDIANLALFLASDQSALITGQTISVDGGRT